jgi:hypothetical protein
MSTAFSLRPFRRLAAAILLVGLTLPLAAHAASFPRSFTLNYCWGTGWPSFSACPEADLTLYANHSVLAVDQATGDTGTGQWSTAQGGKRITLTFPGVTYEGTRTTSSCYQGTMTSPNVAGGGTWAGCYVP